MENEKWNPQKAVQSIRGGVSRLFDNLPASRSLQEENARLKEALESAEAEVQRLNEAIGALRQEANAEARQMLQSFLVQMEALRQDAAQAIDTWREKEEQLQDEETRQHQPPEQAS